MQQYPVGGPREPVYALMRSLGFSESSWSDKHWKSADGIDIRIFGAGSVAGIYLADKLREECGLGELSARLDSLRQKPRAQRMAEWDLRIRAQHD